MSKNTKCPFSYQEKKEALYNLNHSLHHFRNQTLEKFEFAVFCLLVWSPSPFFSIIIFVPCWQLNVTWSWIETVDQTFHQRSKSNDLRVDSTSTLTLPKTIHQWHPKITLVTGSCSRNWMCHPTPTMSGSLSSNPSSQNLRTKLICQPMVPSSKITDAFSLSPGSEPRKALQQCWNMWKKNYVHKNTKCTYSYQEKK